MNHDMHIFDMDGRWGRETGWLYEQLIAAGLDALYQEVTDELERLMSERLLPTRESTLKGTTIIDVGCGQGQVTRRLATYYVDATVVGVDLSPDMIRRARSSGPARANLTFECGDAQNLPFADGSVDVALSVASIKHWPDRAQGLREILRVLRPESPLFLVEANRDSTIDEARHFADHWRLPAGFSALGARYFHHFVAGQSLNPDELLGVLTRAGAKTIDVWTHPGLPFMVATAVKGVASNNLGSSPPA